MSNSALYEGIVYHHRSQPRHSFRYRIALPLLDLDELPELLDRHPLWSARRPAPARFRRADFLGDPSRGLGDEARRLIAARTGRRPTGPVRLLAQPRYLGIGFNPVSFYFAFDADGERLESVIAEVTNTPWGERTAYVAAPATADRGGGPLRARFEKRLHVSPFMPMKQSYELAASEPGETLRIKVRNLEGERTVFAAGLDLERRELTPAATTRLLLARPPATAVALARIYWNAVRLRAKGTRWHARPRPRGVSGRSGPAAAGS